MLLRAVLGWEVPPTARVGLCLFVRVGRVALGSGACLASFSVYRDLELLAIGNDSGIGHWNYVTAARELRTPALKATPGTSAGSFVMDDHAVITSRHYIDCSGGVSVGAYTVMAGVRSTVISHEVDVARSEQTIAAVRIGGHSLIGSNVAIVPGARIPDGSLIAMGSVVSGELSASETLYAGVPARPIRALGPAAFFRRQTRRADIP